jgi:hypothetical protein
LHMQERGVVLIVATDRWTGPLTRALSFVGKTEGQGERARDRAVQGLCPLDVVRQADCMDRVSGQVV